MNYHVREEPRGYKVNDLGAKAPLNVPDVVMIDPCGKCNFKCCFCPCNNSNENTDKRHVIMPFDLFKKTVDGLTEFDEKIPVVELFGFGEPLLNKDFCRMVRYLKDKNVCNLIRTTTNGSLLNKQLCEELIGSGLDYMKISVEGIDNSAYRELCQVDFDLDNLIRCLEFIKDQKSNMKVGVKIISSAFKNPQDRDHFFELFDDYVDYIYIRNVQQNWAEFDEMIVPAGSKDGVYTKNIRTGFKICSFPLTHIVIHANGDIVLCCFDWKHSTSYSNIKNTTVYDAWNGSELRNIRIKHLSDRIEELPFCNNCARRGYGYVDHCAGEILKRL